KQCSGSGRTPLRADPAMTGRRTRPAGSGPTVARPAARAGCVPRAALAPKRRTASTDRDPPPRGTGGGRGPRRPTKITPSPLAGGVPVPGDPVGRRAAAEGEHGGSRPNADDLARVHDHLGDVGAAHQRPVADVAPPRWALRLSHDNLFPGVVRLQRSGPLATPPRGRCAGEAHRYGGAYRAGRIVPRAATRTRDRTGSTPTIGRGEPGRGPRVGGRTGPAPPRTVAGGAPAPVPIFAASVFTAGNRCTATPTSTSMPGGSENAGFNFHSIHPGNISTGPHPSRVARVTPPAQVARNAAMNATTPGAHLTTARQIRAGRDCGSAGRLSRADRSAASQPPTAPRSIADHFAASPGSVSPASAARFATGEASGAAWSARSSARLSAWAVSPVRPVSPASLAWAAASTRPVSPTRSAWAVLSVRPAPPA